LSEPTVFTLSTVTGYGAQHETLAHSRKILTESNIVYATLARTEAAITRRPQQIAATTHNVDDGFLSLMRPV